MAPVWVWPSCGRSRWPTAARWYSTAPRAEAPPSPLSSPSKERHDPDLIAEDEPRISSFIDKGLSANGFAVTVVADGRSAYEYATTGGSTCWCSISVCPELDGFEVLRKLRADGNSIPVVVLTARDSVQDTVAGLEGGADDYMPKPFRFEELLARVRRRLNTERAPETTVLSCGGLQLDLRTRRARVDGRDVELSAREFALAETFLRHPGQVLSGNSCSATCGAMTSTRAPMWSTSTCAICVASWAPSGS